MFNKIFTVSTFLILQILFWVFPAVAQNPQQFKAEIQSLTKKDSLVNTNNLILFTGSSSIRFWKDIQQRFPNYNIINRGFGGSQMSDLLFYADRIVTPYKPQQVFIYEGDNDLAARKSPEQVITDAKKMLEIIRGQLPEKTHVLFISPKPSVARWHLKDKYEALNSQLEAFAKENKNVTFIDVWTPMLDERGEVLKDIFIQDGLHLNKKGYDIWSDVIEKYLNKELKKQ